MFTSVLNGDSTQNIYIYITNFLYIDIYATSLFRIIQVKQHAFKPAPVVQMRVSCVQPEYFLCAPTFASCLDFLLHNSWISTAHREINRSIAIVGVPRVDQIMEQNRITRFKTNGFSHIFLLIQNLWWIRIQRTGVKIEKRYQSINHSNEPEIEFYSHIYRFTYRPGVFNVSMSVCSCLSISTFYSLFISVFLSSYLPICVHGVLVHRLIEQINTTLQSYRFSVVSQQLWHYIDMK